MAYQTEKVEVCESSTIVDKNNHLKILDNETATEAISKETYSNGKWPKIDWLVNERLYTLLTVSEELDITRKINHELWQNEREKAHFLG